MSMMSRTARLRSIDTLAGIFVGILAASALFRADQLSDASSTGIAAIALLLSSLLFQREMLAIDDRSGVVAGSLLGLPLGFFVSQVRYAHAEGNPDLAAGAERLVLAVFVICVATAVVGLRRQRR